MVDSGNNVKSILGFFEICDDALMQDLVLLNWQNDSISFPFSKIVTQWVGVC